MTEGVIMLLAALLLFNAASFFVLMDIRERLDKIIKTLEEEEEE